ncbi:MAG TPA: CvpA family protein [Cytophagales bacterium]|nr:CvpA family protein [Cytophagales bacterium]
MINYVDILLVLLILFNILVGWKRGFILGAFDLVRWTSSLLLAFRLYRPFSSWLEINLTGAALWIDSFAFLFIFFVGNTLLYFLESWFLKIIPPALHDKKFNKVLGAFPGLVNGIVLATFASVTILALPMAEGLRKQVRVSKLINELAKPAEEVETAISPIFDKAVGKTLNGLTVDPDSKKFIKLPYKVNELLAAPELEARMLELINQERAAEGLEPLKADVEMRAVARKHSVDMFNRGYFSHYTPEGSDPFDRMENEGVSFRTAGENLALAPTLSLAHSGLMKSPGHRANILQPKFKRVGIGIMDGGNKGLMVTQNFRN